MIEDKLETTIVVYMDMGGPKIRGTLLVGPSNKVCSILGSRKGSPYFRKLQIYIKPDRVW